MQKEQSKHMKKTLFSFVVFSVLVFSRSAKAQFAGQPMFQQQPQFQGMPQMMDAQQAQMQMAQMQMMRQGGMPPGFVGQVPGSYNDANCLNGSMMMPQAPITPAYYDQQRMMGHQ